jgi:hypothetical protein
METIEEAADKYSKRQLTFGGYSQSTDKFEGFLAGANWQKEQTKFGMADLNKDLQKLIESEREQRWIIMKFMYTEEEVLQLLQRQNDELKCSYCDQSVSNEESVEEWFKNNKKK